MSIISPFSSSWRNQLRTWYIYKVWLHFTLKRLTGKVVKRYQVIISIQYPTVSNRPVISIMLKNKQRECLTAKHDIRMDQRGPLLAMLLIMLVVSFDVLVTIISPPSSPKRPQIIDIFRRWNPSKCCFYNSLLTSKKPINEDVYLRKKSIGYVRDLHYSGYVPSRSKIQTKMLVVDTLLRGLPQILFSLSFCITK